MLLEFRTENYKSFAEEARFSMIAAPKQTGLDYSLLKEMEKGKKKPIKGLCSSVIYGPNASGKTNIIGAMDVFRSIVLRGNIRNSEEKTSPNPAAASLELIPNNKRSNPHPVKFFVDFFENGLRIQYEICLDLGLFLDIEYKRRIISEELAVNGYSVFRRTETLNFDNINVISDYLSDSIKQEGTGIKEIAENSLNPEELFLTNGFKVIFSQSFVKKITEWFANKLMVIYHANFMQISNRFDKKAVYVEKTIDKAAKLFGINSNAIGYVVSGDDSEAQLCSIFENIRGKNLTAVAAELFESYGTIRFINMFPLVIHAIKTGGTLVVDEFDASIHPMALMSIVNVFHNDDININHAQLIFNTHNPIFLKSSLFRRDEIKFVERDDTNHYSTLYALSDFGTKGLGGVRKQEDYIKNYFVSKYGAIKDIDFTPLMIEIMSNREEV